MRTRRRQFLIAWGGWCALSLGLMAAFARSAAALAVLGSLSINNQVVNDVAVSGTHVYLAGAMGVAVVDIADPSQPRLAGGFALPVPGLGIFAAPDRALVYVAAGTAGLRVVDVSDPELPEERGALLDFDNARAVGVAGDRAYVVAGVRGLVVVDVADPAMPVTLHEVALGGCTNLALSGDFVYLTCSEFHVLNATSESDTPLLGSVAVEGGLAVVVVGQVAYVADGTDGLVVIDVEDPAAPRRVGTSPQAFQSKDLVAAGDVVIAADWQDGVRLFDVSDATNPREDAALSTASRPQALALQGDVLFAAVGFKGLRVLDVRPECSDGLDNDLDGAIDYPDDSSVQRAGRSQRARGLRRRTGQRRRWLRRLSGGPRVRKRGPAPRIPGLRRWNRQRRRRSHRSR